MNKKTIILEIISIVCFGLLILLGSITGKNASISHFYNIDSDSESIKHSIDGKTVVLIGDSLIRGYGNEDRGIDYYLSKELQSSTFINCSFSGSTITDNTGDDDIIIINQIKHLNGETPDIILLDGGANDIFGYALGTLHYELEKEIGTVDTNTNTVSKRDSVIVDFEKIIIELNTMFPEAKICYIQPCLLDDDTIAHLTEDDMTQKEIATRRDAFYLELNKACTKWGVAFIDTGALFKGSDLKYRLEDWVHINEDGYLLITPSIVEKLREIS